MGNVMIKKLLASMLVLVTLTGCSAIQSVTSEAYAAGLASGGGYADLKESAENLQSWIPKEDGSESEYLLPFDEKTVREYCTGIWPLVGMPSGLENTDANESDFIAGCLDGAGF
jgi:hypothetical protein